MASTCITVLAQAAFGRFATAGDAPVPGAATASLGDADMQADLARMGSHEYSDEGIPVLLACIDLSAEAAGKAVPAPPFSHEFASQLRRYGDAWQHLHPDAKETDISKVIEVLAERDFAHGGSMGAA